jgi:hypothetical protein
MFLSIIYTYVYLKCMDGIGIGIGIEISAFLHLIQCTVNTKQLSRNISLDKVESDIFINGSFSRIYAIFSRSGRNHFAKGR